PVGGDDVADDAGDAEPELTAAQSKKQTAAEIRERVQERIQEMDAELEDVPAKEQKVYRNQNTVREAVHAMLEMKEELGGIGQRVSEIARNFDNSVEKTIQLEAKVQEKSALKKFFFGGDEETGEELEAEVEQNQERIRELKQLHDECECDDEMKAMLQEQIQNMEQEQERLATVAKKEKSKGIFGWLFRKNAPDTEDAETTEE
ncbi:MAG: hypothetical protein ABIF92_01420, partial [archaeon]